MKIERRYFRFLRVVLLCISLLVVFNNLRYEKSPEGKEAVILGDGRGYYEYLPALFIYNDIHLNYLDTLHTELYDFEQTKTNYQRLPNGERFNKYYVGTALMQAPFFFTAHTIASISKGKHAADGFSQPYQDGIWFAAVFYLVLGLLFIRLLLETYEVNSWWIVGVQLIVVFTTPIVNYTIYDAAYSHVYSFFLVACFAYTARKYFLDRLPKFLILTMLILALIVITRPINLLVLLFTPLLTDSAQLYFQQIRFIFQKHLRVFLYGFFLFCAVICIQLYVSYLQTGNPFVYSYGNEGFDFSDPHINDFLFSYRKGFFLWTPVWFVLFLLSAVYWLLRKNYYQPIAFTAAFLILTYVLSSWHVWSYGASIGQRPMIDFYPLFLLAVVPLIKDKNIIGKTTFVLLAPVFAVVAQVQIYQYVRAMIHWDGMTKEMYWQAFLKTDEKYCWYYFRSQLPVGKLQHRSVIYQSKRIPSGITKYIYPKTPIHCFDSLTRRMEVKLSVNRELDLEKMDIYFFDENNNLVYAAFNGLFQNQYGNAVICRFEVPENIDKKSIHYAQIKVYGLERPFVIKHVVLSTYYN